MPLWTCTQCRKKRTFNGSMRCMDCLDAQGITPKHPKRATFTERYKTAHKYSYGIIRAIQISVAQEMVLNGNRKMDAINKVKCKYSLNTDQVYYILRLNPHLRRDAPEDEVERYDNVSV